MASKLHDAQNRFTAAGYAFRTVREQHAFMRSARQTALRQLETFNETVIAGLAEQEDRAYAEFEAARKELLDAQLDERDTGR